jgi:hypothetical protein
VVMTRSCWSCCADRRQPSAGIFKLGWLVSLCVFGAVLSGCGAIPTDAGTFESARTQDSLSAYQAYLKSYPEGMHRDDALARVDELDFAAARKGNTGPAYSNYLKKHPSGRFVADAWKLTGQILLDQAISARRYSHLLAVEAFAQKHDLAEQVAAVREELAKYARRTVSEEGESLWTLTGEQPVSSRLQIQCAMTSSPAGSIGKLLDDNWADKLIRESYKAAYGLDIPGMSMEWLGKEYCKNEMVPRADASGWHGWLLFPADDADFVRVTEGKIALVNGVGRTAEIASISSRDLLARKEGDSAFTAKAHAGDRPGALVIVLGLCAPSKDDPCPCLVGLGKVCVVESPNVRSAGVSVLPKACAITGTLRIESNRWLPLKEGMEVRGGGVSLDAGGARLLPGTEVVERIE